MIAVLSKARDYLDITRNLIQENKTQENEIVVLETLNETLTNALKNLSDANKSLKEQISAQEIDSETKQTLLTQLRNCNATNLEIKTVNDQIQPNLTQCKKDRRTLQNKLEQNTKYNKTLQTENTKLKVKLRSISTILKEKEEQYEILKKEQQIIKNDCEDYVKNYDTYKQNMKTQKQFNQTQQEKIKTLETKEQNLNKSILKLAENIKTLQITLNKADNSKRTFKRLFDTQLIKTKTLKNEIEKLQQMHKAALNKISKEKQNFTTCAEDNYKKQQNIEKFKASLEARKKAYQKLNEKYTKAKNIGNTFVKRIKKYKKIRTSKHLPTQVHIQDIKTDKPASIKFTYDDGEQDTFTFLGNSGLEFIKSNKKSNLFKKGLWSSDINSFYGFQKKYKIECLEIVDVNTWVFTTPKPESNTNHPKLRYVEFFHKSGWKGFSNVTVKNLYCDR